jgi:acetyl esterase/lipase
MRMSETLKRPTQTLTTSHTVCAQVLRSVEYGGKPRNRLDLYLPKVGPVDDNGKRPVVVFVTGGRWIIGYKAWGALLSTHPPLRGTCTAGW